MTNKIGEDQYGKITIIFFDSMDKQLGFEFVTIYVTDGIVNGTTSVPFLCYELDKGLKSDLVL